jgi:hypothetical protein
MVRAKFSPKGKERAGIRGLDGTGVERKLRG